MLPKEVICSFASLFYVHKMVYLRASKSRWRHMEEIYVAIIGEEGNGKSTLLKIIYDTDLVEDYIEYTGEIIKNHVHIGYLPQEVSKSDKRKMESRSTVIKSNYKDYVSRRNSSLLHQEQVARDEISKIRTYLGSMKYTADEMSHRIGDLSNAEEFSWNHYFCFSRQKVYRRSR